MTGTGQDNVLERDRMSWHSGCSQRRLVGGEIPYLRAVFQGGSLCHEKAHRIQVTIGNGKDQGR
jgi:hypothetical protein